MVKIALVVAVIGVLAVEFGSPFITRVTLDNDAQAIVQDAAHDFSRTNFDADATIERLAPRLEQAGIELRNFDVKGELPRNASLEITVAKPAKSLFAHRIDSFAGYYDVETTATAPITR